MNSPASHPSAVVPFQFESNEVRALTIDGDPWFVAKDVCEILEIVWKGSESVAFLDDDEKGVRKIRTPSGKQDLIVISESGLYTLIIRSNKPQAKPFRKWVTAEVLPAIRKTGCYQAEKQEVVGKDGFHTFDFSGNEITAFVATDGSLWFRSRDITAALGYSNEGQVPHKLCDPRGRRHIACRYKNGTKGKMVFIDEANLFRMLIRSSKTSTSEMQRFFADTVLPALRVACRNQLALEPPSTEDEFIEKLYAKRIRESRLLWCFDKNGTLWAKSVHPDAYVMPIYDMPKIIAEEKLDAKEVEALPRIIEAAIKRITCKQ